MELFSRWRRRLVLAQVLNCWIYDEPKEIKQHMHGTIPNVFDFGASTIVHHLL